jgi:hypothetical protein
MELPRVVGVAGTNAQKVTDRYWPIPEVRTLGAFYRNAGGNEGERRFD